MKESPTSLKMITQYDKMPLNENTIVLFIVIGVFIILLLGLLACKLWEVNFTEKHNKGLLIEFGDQIEMIEEQPDEFVISSIKDKREGIEYFSNPLRFSENSEQITKLQGLAKKHQRYSKLIIKLEEELSDLQLKHSKYNKEIEDQVTELEKIKRKNFEKGNTSRLFDSQI